MSQNLKIFMPVFMLGLCILSACQPAKFIPVHSTTSDSLSIINIRVDSIFIRDSTSTEKRGDTVYTTKYVYKYKYRASQNDTTSAKTDTIYEPYPVEVPLTKWQKIKIDMGEALIVGILILLGLFLYRLFRR